MTWHEDLAKTTGDKHSDTVAVTKAGRKAKRRTRRRNRQQAKNNIQRDK